MTELRPPDPNDADLQAAQEYISLHPWEAARELLRLRKQVMELTAEVGVLRGVAGAFAKGQSFIIVTTAEEILRREG